MIIIIAHPFHFFQLLVKYEKILHSAIFFPYEYKHITQCYQLLYNNYSWGIFSIIYNVISYILLMIPFQWGVGVWKADACMHTHYVIVCSGPIFKTSVDKLTLKPDGDVLKVEKGALVKAQNDDLHSCDERSSAREEWMEGVKSWLKVANASVWKISVGRWCSAEKDLQG